MIFLVRKEEGELPFETPFKGVSPMYNKGGRLPQGKALW